MKKIGVWIEAMRLRTLPVSIAGVLTAVALALRDGSFKVLPSLLCLAFAVLAQISSNFANEYYDFKSGLDKKGRSGPRRGVTEGDITPSAMKIATFATLFVAGMIGLSLIVYGGWWLIIVGIIIALGVMAYSTGPYPLSHHGLGEVAVLFFFGIIPVNFTFYVMSGYFDEIVFITSIAIGLMGANVLIVNNYRDYEDDKSVNKNTLAVIFGKRAAYILYVANGLIAFVLLLFANHSIFGIVVYLVLHLVLSYKIPKTNGKELNKFLGKTSLLMFVFSVILVINQIIG